MSLSKECQLAFLTETISGLQRIVDGRINDIPDNWNEYELRKFIVSLAETKLLDQDQDCNEAYETQLKESDLLNSKYCAKCGRVFDSKTEYDEHPKYPDIYKHKGCNW